VQRSVILQRQEIVSLIASHPDIILTLEKELEKLSDIERIIGRIALDRATINDYLSLKESLKIIPIIKNIINTKINTPLGLTLSERLIDLNVLKDFLDASINNNPEYNWRVKSGFDLALDRLRSLVKDGHKEILALESREISSTGINSLKIGYNQISGYYIEVTAPNLSKVPEHYQHIQTLANRTRFTTQELKLLETEIFKAQNEIESTESLVFSRITKEISGYLSQLRQISQSLAYLDGLFGFAKAAYNFNYSFPSFNNTHDIIITQGRHPVVEQANLIKFIPNDTKLTNQESLWIITGPNMGGKSTYLRQVALICIMAHCGSGVPAQQASIPILDRIFTRIGAGDNVSEGKSTFLVEMEETATICTQATEKSLVVLDEVGRGTSTYDGIALAHAIIEHIANNIKAKCLFATHYHELTTLSKESLGILNYHMACQPKGDNILFLYTMIPGVAPGSFGLQVARMAQLPESIIIRAKEILNIIFSQEKESATQLYKKQADIPENQEFSPELREFLTRFKNYNLDELSGRQALDLLWALKELL
jgi:DNA mismatch repair protein MutS